MRRPAQALAFVKAALRISSNSTDLRILHAHAFLQAGMLREAAREASAAVHLDPSSLAALACRAFVLLRSKQIRLAMLDVASRLQVRIRPISDLFVQL